MFIIQLSICRLGPWQSPSLSFDVSYCILILYSLFFSPPTRPLWRRLLSLSNRFMHLFTLWYWVLDRDWGPPSPGSEETKQHHHHSHLTPAQVFCSPQKIRHSLHDWGRHCCTQREKVPLQSSTWARGAILNCKSHLHTHGVLPRGSQGASKDWTGGTNIFWQFAVRWGIAWEMLPSNQKIESDRERHVLTRLTWQRGKTSWVMESEMLFQSIDMILAHSNCVPFAWEILFLTD